MTPQRAGELAALLAALLTALPLAWRARPHRPLTAALALLLALDVARLWTAGPPLGSAPATPRWALDVALGAAWYVVIATAVTGASTARWRAAAGLGAAAWLATTLALLALKLADPSTPMAAHWRALYLAALALECAIAAPFLRRAWRRPWTAAEQVALLLTASGVAGLAGPWLRPIPLPAAWPLAVLSSTMTWGAVALLQGRFVWRSPPRCTSRSAPSPPLPSSL